jgi:biopolymer transport protein ExbD
MALALPRSALEPLADLNTTPLIDVMLVLLVMLIVTIPVATNVVAVDLPQPSEIPAHLDPIQNTVVITPDDRIEWNGTTVDRHQLTGLLISSRHLPVEPLLRLQPAGSAAYGLSAQVARTIKMSGVTTLAFVGNDQFANSARQAAAR